MILLLTHNTEQEEKPPTLVLLEHFESVVPEALGQWSRQVKATQEPTGQIGLCMMPSNTILVLAAS